MRKLEIIRLLLSLRKKKALKSDGIKTGSTLDQEMSSQTVAFEGASNADKQSLKTKASSDLRGHAQKSDVNDAGKKQLTKWRNIPNLPSLNRQLLELPL